MLQRCVLGDHACLTSECPVQMLCASTELRCTLKLLFQDACNTCAMQCATTSQAVHKQDKQRGAQGVMPGHACRGRD